MVFLEIFCYFKKTWYFLYNDTSKLFSVFTLSTNKYHYLRITIFGFFNEGNFEIKYGDENFRKYSYSGVGNMGP